jgi:hypothetical protein
MSHWRIQMKPPPCCESVFAEIRHYTGPLVPFPVYTFYSSRRMSMIAPTPSTFSAHLASQPTRPKRPTVRPCLLPPVEARLHRRRLHAIVPPRPSHPLHSVQDSLLIPLILSHYTPFNPSLMSLNDEGLGSNLWRGRGKSIIGDHDVGEEGSEQRIITSQSQPHGSVGYQHART